MLLVLVLSTTGLIVALGAGVLAWSSASETRRWRARHEALETNVAALQRELELVASIITRTGLRVQRVEHEYSDVAERVDFVETRSQASGGLDAAIEWARHGADSDKLSERFGLSSGEAELVARLHGRKSA